jgi:hypothetical protein
MMKAFLPAMLLVLMVPAAAAQTTLSLKLMVNNTDNDVYVPGTGEIQSSELGAETFYYNTPHYYIASYLSGLLVALAGGSGNSLSTEGGPDYHVIGFSQELGEPVFLGFTQGGWEDIEGRTTDLESGDFLDYVSPSFAFGLGDYHPLKVALTYTGIDIRGALSASKGIYKLVIENKGQQGGRPVVEIRDV